MITDANVLDDFHRYGHWLYAAQISAENAQLHFSGRRDCRDQVSGWIKGSSATAGLGFQLQNNTSYGVATPYGKAYPGQSLLEAGFQSSLELGIAINLSEFGQPPRNYTEDRGGLAWMADTLDLIDTVWDIRTELGWAQPQLGTLQQPLRPSRSGLHRLSATESIQDAEPVSA